MAGRFFAPRRWRSRGSSEIADLTEPKETEVERNSAAEALRGATKGVDLAVGAAEAKGNLATRGGSSGEADGDVGVAFRGEVSQERAETVPKAGFGVGFKGAGFKVEDFPEEVKEGFLGVDFRAGGDNLAAKEKGVAEEAWGAGEIPPTSTADWIPTATGCWIRRKSTSGRG